MDRIITSHCVVGTDRPEEGSGMAAPAHRAASQPAACDTPGTEGLDFRAPGDDAWYTVRLRLEEDGVLRVMYCNFSEVYDERYQAEGFRTVEELEEFRDRFRLTTLQLQDDECWKVIEGMEVCACHTFGESDIRFYTAVVDAVSAWYFRVSLLIYDVTC